MCMFVLHAISLFPKHQPHTILLLHIPRPTAQLPTDNHQNIRVIAKYYHRIHLTRLTELLDLSPATTERTICKLVTDKTIHARIDRPRGIVTFKPRHQVHDVLNTWSGDLGKMLGLVEKTSHLVSKEYAMHEASKKGGVRA